jgi:hypothetical protein
MTPTVIQKVEHVIETVNSGLGNIHCLAPYDTTLSDCMNTISQNPDKSSCFTKTFGFNPEVVLELLPYVSGLNLTDIVIKRFVNEEEEPFTRMLHIDPPHVSGLFS